ncbi:hypothetical protein [Chryseobacterium fistulae]|uniref:Uncharacterized protein n=1 Tax=Chryseobacterium fistulae TaxID=2675058 RepID=A0A6N4XMF0_9FLAO|nr:hypothetical protein [Chryseobacterium fistulae]CAA7386957.1 hypothetical protein CHRY9393_01258 [Chryseobacterium fistulae]
MILIDYLYYQFANFYYHFEKDGTHKASGIIGTCGILSWNLIFILMIVDQFFNRHILPSNKYLVLVYCIPVILFVGVRYWKFTSYEEIDERVKSFNKNKRIVLDILLILYIIISLPIFIGFAAYLGSSK